MFQTWQSYFIAMVSLSFIFLIPTHQTEAGEYREYRGNRNYRHESQYGRGYGYHGWRGYYSYNWPRYYAYYGDTAYYAYPYYSTYAYSYPSYYTNYTYPSYPYRGYYYKNDSILSSNPPNSLGMGAFYNNY